MAQLQCCRWHVCLLTLLIAAQCFAEILSDESSSSSLEALNTMKLPKLSAEEWHELRRARRLLASGGSCACVCGGTHEGYVPYVSCCLQRRPLTL